jgi:hypothetical protein
MSSDQQIIGMMGHLAQEAEKHEKARKQALENARIAPTPAATTKALEEAKKCETKRNECIAEREIWKKKLTQREERQRERQTTTKKDLDKEIAKAKAKVGNPQAHSAEQRIKEKLEAMQKERMQQTTRDRDVLRPGEQQMKERLEKMQRTAREATRVGFSSGDGGNGGPSKAQPEAEQKRQLEALEAYKLQQSQSR